MLSLLGRGGMGVVYKVEQIFLGKELALKTIQKSEQTEAVLRRFETEARAVFSVHHPNIIAVHDFGLLEDQTPFMAMEFVDGKTLGQVLKNRQLSVDEATPLFIQICFGLAHAHESGIVHRDIKPNNIMILNNMDWGTEGSVKILDFGIAKLAQHEGGEIQSLTRTGEIFGSPLYMSPEQCLGGKLDHRSDIYSLGCVLFEALTGTPPFVGENAMSTMMMHQRASVPTLKEASLGQEFPPVLEQIVRGMLAKNPDERYQNLGYAAHDLADMKRGVKAETSLAVTIPRPVKPDVLAPDIVKIEKGHFFLILICTAAICAILTGAATHMLHPIKKQNPPVPSTVFVEERKVVNDLLPGIGTDDQEVDIKNKINNREGEFSATNYPTDKTLAAFEDYENAQIVSFTDCAVTDAGLRHLNKSKVLELTLAGDKNIKSAEDIAKMTYLQKVNLANTNVTDEALLKLSKLPMLDQLDVTGCEHISEKGLAALTASKSLSLVQLSENKFSKDFIDGLRNKLPQCEFRPYFERSALMEEDSKTNKTKTLERSEHLYNFVLKATPESNYAVRYALAIAVDRTAPMKIRDEYAKRAETICEKSKNWKELCNGTLSYMAERARQQGRMKGLCCKNFRRVVKRKRRTNFFGPVSVANQCGRSRSAVFDSGVR